MTNFLIGYIWTAAWLPLITRIVRGRMGRTGPYWADLLTVASLCTIVFIAFAFATWGFPAGAATNIVAALILALVRRSPRHGVA